jgi:transcription termination factor Rho
LASRGDAVARASDLLAPLGRGGRAIVAVPPRVDATSTLVTIARGILANDAGAHLIVLSIDGRPEDALNLQRRIDGEIVATTFDEHPDHHIATAELVMERAKRLVELGTDVVIVLDSLTRLARAFGPGNTAGRPPDFTSVTKPKRFFGAARACEEGGSLTIVAVVGIDGASAFDAVVAEEAAAISSGEYVLSYELATSGIATPIDVRASLTREPELLLTEAEAKRARELRATFPARSALDVAAALADDVPAGRA